MQFLDLLPERKHSPLIRRRAWETREVHCHLLPGRLALLIGETEVLDNWSPSIEDVLANDWEIISQPNRPSGLLSRLSILVPALLRR